MAYRALAGSHGGCLKRTAYLSERSACTLTVSVGCTKLFYLFHERISTTETRDRRPARANRPHNTTSSIKYRVKVKQPNIVKSTLVR